jgi:sigma-E factor negative regulatory protein RseB
MQRTFAFLRIVFFIGLNLVALLAKAESNDQQSNIRDAQKWLSKVQIAAQKLNYSGTFVYQQGNQVKTSRITHVSEGKSEIEKLEVLDGKQREYIRNDEEITCYIPEEKTLIVEKRLTPDVFPAIFSTNSTALTEYYKLKKGESGRVAGHDCQSIELTPKDDLRYGYRLWAEKSSGLLLRTQTLNEKKEVIEQISFTDIQIGNIPRNRVKPSYNNTQNWHVESPVMKQVEFSGWKVNALPPGFKKIREIKRTIIDTQNHNTVSTANQGKKPMVSGQREVSQLVFSDGLAAISVFIEPSSQSKTEGSLQQGAMSITGKRQGDFWITIVGEVPSSAIKNVANSIEFQSK